MKQKIPSLLYHVTTKSYFNKFSKTQPYVSDKEFIHTIVPREEATRIANKLFSSEKEVLLLIIRSDEIQNEIRKAEDNCWHIVGSLNRNTFDMEIVEKKDNEKFV